jgi:UDP-3-O-[3-hydroxymyristoyl] glucosamine N-acyltransferase
MENKTLTARQAAEMVGGELAGKEDIVFTGVAALRDAGPSQISFLGNKKYAQQAKESSAGLLLVEKTYSEPPREGQALVKCERPEVEFSKVAMFFAPPPIKFPPGIHSSAVIAKSAKIGSGVHIGANVTVEEEAVIGDNSVVAANCYVGHFAKIGRGCLIYPLVSIRERCVIGNNVIVHGCAVIGSDGFGFAPDPKGGLMKLPQTGIVQIDDDVEIGACVTIDRARFGKTWLKRGVKVDNLVQIAHNVVVGEFSLLIAQCGIAGSAEIGRGVILAAKVGINGHISLGDGVKVAGTSGVAKSVPAGKEVMGTPAEFPREWFERFSLPRKAKKLEEKIEKLEAALEKLTGKPLD